MYQGVTLGGTGFARGKRHPTVGDEVMIGAGAKLLGPIEVGARAKIGANSVVIHDVPPNSTVVGNPGHPVRVDGSKPSGPDADWVHLPDPVADAIRGLANRLTEVEELLAELTGRKPEGADVKPLQRPPRPGLGRRLSPPEPAFAAPSHTAPTRNTEPGTLAGCREFIHMTCTKSRHPPRMPARRISVPRIAARQWGAISSRQLRACGLNATQIARRVDAGRLVRLHRGVYAWGHARLRREGLLMAAVLAAGEGAAASHHSAGAHWELLFTAARAL